MGEIADAMINGDMCEGCGIYLGEGSGYPRYCSDACAQERGMLPKKKSKKKRKTEMRRTQKIRYISGAIAVVLCLFLAKQTRAEDYFSQEFFEHQNARRDEMYNEQAIEQQRADYQTQEAFAPMPESEPQADYTGYSPMERMTGCDAPHTCMGYR